MENNALRAFLCGTCVRLIYALYKFLSAIECLRLESWQWAHAIRVTFRIFFRLFAFYLTAELFMKMKSLSCQTHLFRLHVNGVGGRYTILRLLNT